MSFLLKFVQSIGHHTQPAPVHTNNPLQPVAQSAQQVAQSAFTSGASSSNPSPIVINQTPPVAQSTQQVAQSAFTSGASSSNPSPIVIDQKLSELLDQLKEFPRSELSEKTPEQVLTIFSEFASVYLLSPKREEVLEARFIKSIVDSAKYIKNLSSFLAILKCYSINKEEFIFQLEELLYRGNKYMCSDLGESVSIDIKNATNILCNFAWAQDVSDSFVEWVASREFPNTNPEVAFAILKHYIVGRFSNKSIEELSYSTYEFATQLGLCSSQTLLIWNQLCENAKNPSAIDHPPIISTKRIDLEHEFSSICCPEVCDFSAINEFDRFLTPNEFEIYHLQHLLQTLTPPTHPGLLMSVGTERSISLFLLTPKSWRTGLIVRDINPHVKAYLDFVFLVTRLSKNREEFISLSDMTALDQPLEMQLNSRVGQLQELLASSSIREPMRSYYMKNLPRLAAIYASTQDRDIWKTAPQLDSTNYRKYDHLFRELKEGVESGSIIATIGGIDDLSPLQSYQANTDFHPIIVDTSNVDAYHILDFTGLPGFQTEIIQTITGVRRMPTHYKHYHHINLTDEEHRELEDLFKKILCVTNLNDVPNTSCVSQQLANKLYFLGHGSNWRLEGVKGPTYSQATLNIAKKYLNSRYKFKSQYFGF